MVLRHDLVNMLVAAAATNTCYQQDEDAHEIDSSLIKVELALSYSKQAPRVH